MDYKEQAPGTPDGYRGQKYGDKDTEKLPRFYTYPTRADILRR